MQTTEIWKDIKGYEGKYKVSDKGRVKSCLCWSGNKLIYKEKILKPSVTHKGYLIVCLSNKNQAKVLKVHRLVAETFIKNPKNKPQVNHIDSNRTNNNVKNLEWVNNSENQIHAFKYGNQKRYKGSKNYSSIEILQFDLNNKLIREWGSITEAAEYEKIGISSICNCLRKRSYSAGGYIWKYKEGCRCGYYRNNRRHINRLQNTKIKNKLTFRYKRNRNNRTT